MEVLESSMSEVWTMNWDLVGIIILVGVWLISSCIIIIHIFFPEKFTCLNIEPIVCSRCGNPYQKYVSYMHGMPHILYSPCECEEN